MSIPGYFDHTMGRGADAANQGNSPRENTTLAVSVEGGIILNEGWVISLCSYIYKNVELLELPQTTMIQY